MAKVRGSFSKLSSSQSDSFKTSTDGLGKDKYDSQLALVDVYVSSFSVERHSYESVYYIFLLSSSGF